MLGNFEDRGHDRRQHSTSISFRHGIGKLSVDEIKLDLNCGLKQT